MSCISFVIMFISLCVNLTLRFRRGQKKKKFGELSIFIASIKECKVSFYAVIADQFKQLLQNQTFLLGLLLMFSVAWPLLSCAGRSFLISQEVLDVFQRKYIASRTTFYNHTSLNSHSTLWPRSFFFFFHLFHFPSSCNDRSHILYQHGIQQ